MSQATNIILGAVACFDAMEHLISKYSVDVEVYRMSSNAVYLRLVGKPFPYGDELVRTEITLVQHQESSHYQSGWQAMIRLINELLNKLKKTKD